MLQEQNLFLFSFSHFNLEWKCGIGNIIKGFFFFNCIVSYLDTFLTVEVKVQNVPKATDAKNMEERRKLFLHTKKGISAKTHQKKS